MVVAVSPLPLDELVPGLAGLGLSLAGLAVCGRLIARAFAARSWAVVEGRVQSCETRVTGRAGDSSGRGVKTTVTYEYVVGTTRFVSTRAWFGDGFDRSAATAEALKDRFVPGQPVELRYDPRRPSEATLEARASWLVWLGLWGSLALAAVLVNELFLRR